MRLPYTPIHRILAVQENKFFCCCKTTKEKITYRRMSATCTSRCLRPRIVAVVGLASIDRNHTDNNNLA